MRISMPRAPGNETGPSPFFTHKKILIYFNTIIKLQLVMNPILDLRRERHAPPIPRLGFGPAEDLIGRATRGACGAGATRSPRRGRAAQRAPRGPEH